MSNYIIRRFKGYYAFFTQYPLTYFSTKAVIDAYNALQAINKLPKGNNGKSLKGRNNEQILQDGVSY